MRIVYKNLAGNGGAMASVKLLLRAMVVEFSEDQFTIVCIEDSDLRSLGEMPNVQVMPVRAGVVKELSRCYLETFGIGRIAREGKADVIWSANVGPYVRTGIPQVLSVTNPHQVYPWRFSRYHPRSRFTVALLRMFFRRSLRYCDAVLVQMPLTGEYVRCIPGAPERITAIPKAVESAEDFEPQPLSSEIQKWFDGGLGRSAFTFLFVATYIPHKNHATVVAAINMLRSQNVAARLVLTVNEKQLCQFCDAKLLSGLIKSGHVLLVGWIRKEQLVALYDTCNACVMPSVLESLSSAHLEAMQWRKPQICADLPYAHDLCDGAALYAEAENPADWAAKMRILMENPTERERLVTAGLERMTTFPQTWQEVARRVRAFLAEVATGG